MIDIKVFLLISIILMSLVVIIIVLFMKHLKTIHIFMEQIFKEQSVLYKEMLNIKSSLEINNEIMKKEIKSYSNKVNNPLNQNINTLKSSKVSQQELLELIKGKKLGSKKEVTIKPGGAFMDIDIKGRK
jgi:hypothetical protein